jgi:hypothetical protein
VQRGIFEPKREELKNEWRKLHKEELDDLYCSLNILRVNKSRRRRLAVHVTRIGEIRGSYTFFVGKPERIIPLGRNRRRWEDNIKIELSEVEGGMDCVDMAWDRNSWRTLVNAIMNLRVP